MQSRPDTKPIMMQLGRSKMFTDFLEEHPGFSPRLVDENTLVCGFQVGGCLLPN
jgi:hypothetical protein